MQTDSSPPPVAIRVGRPHLGHIRYLALISVAGLTATTLATFGLAIAKTVKVAVNLAHGGWRGELAVVDLLSAVDSHLLAVVQLIVTIGLYELFIGDLDVPSWLEVRSLEDLKKPIVDVLVLFVAIRGIEAFLVAPRPTDALLVAGAVALLIVSLALYRYLTPLSSSAARNPKEHPHEMPNLHRHHPGPDHTGER